MNRYRKGRKSFSPETLKISSRKRRLKMRSIYAVIHHVTNKAKSLGVSISTSNRSKASLLQLNKNLEVERRRQEVETGVDPWLRK